MEDLTGYETMRIIAMLRGYPDYRIKYVINRLAEEFYFTKHLHKAIKKYSGGTKRKLSTALTLIGNTAIVVLGISTQLNYFLHTFQFKIHSQMSQLLGLIQLHESSYGMSSIRHVNPARQSC